MKEIIGITATVLTFIAYIPYYRDIWKGRTHPHIYTWSLWAFLTILLVALQIKGGAGSAVYVTAAAGLLCVGVVLLSFKNGKRDITTSDTVVTILALIAIFFWLIVDQPIISMVLIITADMLALIPTIRKSYNQPYSETLSLYVTNIIRYGLALFAVERYTFLSAAWIIAWICGNILLSTILVIRRYQIADKNVK